MTTEIESIIGRLEKATGPDREIDRLIALRLGTIRRWTTPVPSGEEDYGVFGDVNFHEGFPQYTSSLDAAVSLVPKGFAWQVTKRFINCGAKVQAPNETVDDIFSNFKGNIPAIALCIAALRARLSQNTGG